MLIREEQDRKRDLLIRQEQNRNSDLMSREEQDRNGDLMIRQKQERNSDLMSRQEQERNSDLMSRIPQYRLVYETLRKHIGGGVYSEGDLLPSENELCALHGVTRPTVRKALDRLLNEGYIKKQQGKGSIVRDRPKGVGILSITGTTSAIGKEKLQTRIIVKPELRKVERAFNFELSELERELGCIYMERLRLVNGKPVFYDITILPNINLPRFMSRNMENHSLFDVLRQNYQLEVTGGEQQMLAKLADKKLQKHFDVGPRHPIIQLNRRLETNRMNYSFYSQVSCNTDEYMLEGEI